MAPSTADFNNDDWLSSEVIHDSAAQALIVRLRAKQSVRVVEVQGHATDLEAFGLSMPAGFRKLLFGDGAKVPDTMKSEFEHMGRLNFGWGCDFILARGAKAELSPVQQCARPNRGGMRGVEPTIAGPRPANLALGLIELHNPHSQHQQGEVHANRRQPDQLEGGSWEDIPCPPPCSRPCQQALEAGAADRPRCAMQSILPCCGPVVIR